MNNQELQRALPDWEDMRAFEYNVYPNNLLIVTNCPEHEYRLIVKSYDIISEIDGNTGNLSDYIMSNTRYFAVACDADVIKEEV